MRLGLNALISISLGSVIVGAAAVGSAADPTTADCLTASETSLKLRAAHKLRDARAQLLVCAATTCPGDIREECARRVVDLNAAIPTVVFEAKDGAGNDLTEVRVAMDGQPLADRLEGASISIDPGPHTFSFTMAGQPAVEKMLVIQEGEKERHVRIVLGQPSAPATGAPAAVPPTPVSPAATPAPTVPASPPPGADAGASGSWSTQKTIALVVGGVGVAGLAVGTIFGLIASSDWNNAKNECSSPTNCTNPQASRSDHDATVTAGTVSTVSFVAGGAALAAGAVLFFTAPASHEGGATIRVAPTLGPGVGGLRVEGAF